jgi:hypothetical protein
MREGERGGGREIEIEHSCQRQQFYKTKKRTTSLDSIDDRGKEN